MTFKGSLKIVIVEHLFLFIYCILITLVFHASGHNDNFGQYSEHYNSLHVKTITTIDIGWVSPLVTIARVIVYLDKTFEVREGRRTRDLRQLY